MRREINLNEISGQVVDAAMKVHAALGSGLLENTYEACLKHELEKRGLRTEQFQHRAAQGWYQTDGEQLMIKRNLLRVLCG